MEFIGEYLKNSRNKKRLTIKKVAHELKISESLLKNIENDYFPEYINTVFLIGHIRSYAKFLNLDYHKVIEDFKIQISYNLESDYDEISKPIQTKNFFSFSKTFSFCAILIIAGGFYLLFVEPNDLHPDYAMTPDLPENLNHYLEKTEMDIVLSNEINKNLKLEDKTKLPSFYIDLDEEYAASSVIASVPDKNNIEDNDQMINLKFLNSTWIQLRNTNDKIIISKLMNKDEEYTYKISENLSLTAGNAGNIIVSLDGIVKGKVGKSGQVVDALIIDSNFNK
jgi:cytoskeletal protein RodZ